MKNIIFAILLFTFFCACHSSQKAETEKLNKAFNESIKNKDEKLMFQNGIDFFAEGSQPNNWNLKMDYDDTVRFNADDGLSLKFAYNQLQKDINAERSILSTKIKAGNISITVLEKDCTIPIKKEVFTKEVTYL
jgi:hypothetical protein